MNRLLKIALPVALAASLLGAGAIWTANQSTTMEIPESMCGVSVDPDLSAPLLGSGDDVTVQDDVDRKEATSSWCNVLVDNRKAVEFKFSWHSDVIDPMKYAASGSRVNGLWNPRSIQGLGDRAALGDDGALVTATCRVKNTDYFTLFMRVVRGGGEKGQRDAVEKFIRAYFPAAVKTLNCR